MARERSAGLAVVQDDLAVDNGRGEAAEEGLRDTPGHRDAPVIPDRLRPRETQMFFRIESESDLLPSATKMTSSDDLWNVVRFCVPSDAARGVEDGIRTIGKLPHLEHWRPEVYGWGDVIALLRIGLPLAILDGNCSFDPVRGRLAESLLEVGKPELADLAELSAGALLASLGAREVRYLKQTGKATQDLLTWWDDSRIPVEAEVTSAKEKLQQVERRHIANAIAGAIRPLSLPWGIVVHFLDTPSEAERTALLKAAQETQLGGISEQPHRWELRAQEVPHDRPPDQMLKGGEKDEPPAWWPHQPATPFIVSQTGVGPQLSHPVPQVRIRWGLSVGAYVNPVEKKLSPFQGSGQHAFLIAIDVSHLPGAFVWYRENLPAYCPTWRSVSGVLAFEMSASTRKLFWTWQIYENVHGRRSLPDAVHRLCFQQEMETGFDLYGPVGAHD